MSFETVLADDREEERFQSELRAKKLRRGQINIQSEARQKIREASQRSAAPEKSAIQIEYEQELEKEREQQKNCRSKFSS